MDENNYQLVGVMKLFIKNPQFIYPVFKKGNDFYIHEYTSLYINNFIKIDPEYYSLIHLLKNLNLTVGNIQSYYHIGSEEVIGFQLTDGNMFVGDFNSFMKYKEQISITDSDVLEDIYDLVQRHTSKQYTK